MLEPTYCREGMAPANLGSENCGGFCSGIFEHTKKGLLVVNSFSARALRHQRHRRSLNFAISSFVFTETKRKSTAILSAARLRMHLSPSGCCQRTTARKTPAILDGNARIKSWQPMSNS